MQDFWNRLLKALRVLTSGSLTPPDISSRKKEFDKILEQLVLNYPEINDKLIIRDGFYNYNYDDKGTLLKIDYCIPDLGVFILFGDIYSGSKTTLELYNLDPEEAVKRRSEENLVLSFFSRMRKKEDIKFIYFSWEDPLTYTTVVHKMITNGVINE